MFLICKQELLLSPCDIFNDLTDLTRAGIIVHVELVKHSHAHVIKLCSTYFVERQHLVAQRIWWINR